LQFVDDLSVVDALTANGQLAGVGGAIEMSEIEIGKRFIAASGKISAWPEVAVHVPAVGIPDKREMLVALLREFARRTAAEHRGNPEVACPQLRVINALARQLLARRWAETGHPSCAKAGTMLQSVTVR
jgi:hypothetical protein